MVHIEVEPAMDWFSSTGMLEPIPGTYFDLQKVRLVIAVKMKKDTSAAFESPQKNNLVRSLRVHTKKLARSLRVHRIFRQQLSYAKTGTS